MKRSVSPALIGLLLLTGCSSTRLAYNNADWLLKREVTRHTCPDGVQEKKLDATIGALHIWHRRQELPRYARTLRALAAGVGTAKQGQAVERFLADIKEAGERFSVGMARHGTAYLVSLGDHQRSCITRSMIRQYDKNRADFKLPPAGYVDKMRGKLESRMGDWIGTFSTEQTAAVDKMLARRRPLHRKVTLAWRNWSGRLISLLERKATAGELEKKLSDRFALYSKKDRKLLLRWDEENRAITRALARMLDDRQKKKLKKKLLEMAGELEALSRE